MPLRLRLARGLGRRHGLRDPDRARPGRAQNAANAQHTLTAAAPLPPSAPPSPPVVARNNAACQRYASSAVHDYNQGIGQKACVSKVRADAGRWHADFNRHYDWCVTVQTADRNSESSIRDKLLLGCGARSTL